MNTVRKAQSMPNSEPLAAWAREFMFPDHNPDEAIVKALAHFHTEAVSGSRSYLPDHMRLWDIRVIADAIRVWWGRRELEIHHPVEIFSAVDVARRVSKWRRVLNPA
ncbi:hypothetical protein N9H39_11600 [Gammaproteobacteria bacterium]|nr:hypothetical protein [Gammaproteobacteria bacterium]